MSDKMFLLKYSEILAMLWEFKDKIDATIAEIDKMGESLTTFLESSSFEGETANSIKSYFNEIHGSMLSSIKTTAQRVQDDMARYKAGFCTIDAYTNFILDQDIIQQYDQAMNDYCDDTEGYMEEISKALATTASIFNYTYPSGSEKDVTTEHSNMDQKLIQFKSDITAHESDIVNDVTKVTEQMINQISVVNKTIGVEWKDLKDYNSGDGNNNLELCKLVYVAGELDAERKENEEVYVQIWDNEVSLKEKAEAREEQGVWEMIGGGILAITGVVCIVCTGGAATPIVVAGWVAGGGTVAFGMADMIEGSDDIYYGSIGDINSTSTNDIKTLIKNLGGDEKTYYMIENAFAFTASALCPIGKASIAKELTFKSGAQILVREGVSDFTAGKVSDFVYNKTGNRVLSMAAGMASSAGTSKAFDYGDVALGWAKNKVTSVGTPKGNSSFADGMSPEDAKRYLDFLENGSKSGLSEVELYGITKVDEHLAFQKIDYQRVIDLRNSGNKLDVDCGKGIESGLYSADDIIRDGSQLENGKLKADITYKTGEFDYIYKTDSKGRISNWSTDDLQLTERAERLPHNPNTPGKIEGDHAGHLAGDRFGGSPEIDNLVSQSSSVNLSEYKKIENQWAKAISEGKKVTTNVEILYDGDSLRPKGFKVRYTIDGVAYSKRILN